MLSAVSGVIQVSFPHYLQAMFKVPECMLPGNLMAASAAVP
ncbi:Unknown protein sequence [Pseudomonas syringae pv. maculicola]|nr:Unknown protein sequence [Pseudomonas syringae pv. maculicola]